MCCVIVCLLLHAHALYVLLYHGMLYTKGKTASIRQCVTVSLNHKNGYILWVHGICNWRVLTFRLQLQYALVANHSQWEMLWTWMRCIYSLAEKKPCTPQKNQNKNKTKLCLKDKATKCICFEFDVHIWWLNGTMAEGRLSLFSQFIFVKENRQNKPFR